MSCGTFRIVVSAGCILTEDLEAFRFAKNDLDCSLACFDDKSGDGGNGGKEVKVGDLGDLGDSCGPDIDVLDGEPGCPTCLNLKLGSSLASTSFRIALSEVCLGLFSGYDTSVICDWVGLVKASTGLGIVKDNLAVFVLLILRKSSRMLQSTALLAGITEIKRRVLICFEVCGWRAS